MKKIYVGLLIMSCLYLVGCQNTTSQENTTDIITLPPVTTETMSDASFSDATSGATIDTMPSAVIENTTESVTSITESVCESNTSEISFTETTYESTVTTTKVIETTTTEKPSNPINDNYPIPNDNKIVSLNVDARQQYIEARSRIVFNHSSEGRLVGDSYMSGDNFGLYYYSKVDGESYIYCFDPLCNHSNCVAKRFSMSTLHYCNDRFYSIDDEKIYSFAFDGSDLRLEWDLAEHTEIKVGKWSNMLAYDRYIFLVSTLTNGDRHILRYNTTTQTMMDLTQETGNYIHYEFIYNGELYGKKADYSGYVKSDWNLSNIQPVSSAIADIFAGGFSVQLTSEGSFIGVLNEKNTSGKNVSFGIQSFDMITGQKILITNADLGHEVSSVIYADNMYFYFLAKEPVVVGESKSGMSISNSYGGKIYRVKRDGTDCRCIYDQSKMKFYAKGIIVYDNDVILYASKYSIVNGSVLSISEGYYIGHFDHNGNIVDLKWLSAIA